MADCIIWDKEKQEIVFVPLAFNVRNKTHKALENAYCINPNKGNFGDRYGQWYDYDNPSGFCNNWRHIPKEKFPKEFLANLLLLGLDDG